MLLVYPQDLLIAKLAAYGLDKPIFNLVNDYKRKYQQYDLRFQSIFPFLITMFTRKLLISEMFKVTLGIRAIKPTYVLTSSQTIYLTNPDDATNCVTSQSSERIDFFCDREEADTKMFAYIKFLCDNIRLNRIIIISPDTDIKVISLYLSVTNLTFLDAIWFNISIKLILISEIYPCTPSSFRIGITDMLLTSCNACNTKT